MTTRVVTLGGGGFSMEPDHLLLDEWLLTIAGRARPRVCFVGTASGDADAYVQRFYTAFESLGAACDHLPLFRRRRGDLGAFLAAQDVVYVGGGNTPNLIAVWQVHGLGPHLVEAGRRGTLLAGVSAGALCWFEGGVTDGFGGVDAWRGGLGLLSGSFCPHWDGEPERRPVFVDAVASGALPPGVAADDGAAVLWVDGRPTQLQRSRPGASAWWVGAGGIEPLSVPLAPAGHLSPRW